MRERYSRDLKRLLNLELERNNRIRAVLNAYEELAEGEKALFRLAAEISQDRADATIEPKQRSSNALMRRHLWIASGGLSLPARDSDSDKAPASLYDRLIDTLAYAA